MTAGSRPRANQAQGSNMLLQIALSMPQQNGGLEGVLNRLRQGGLAQQADSWVSTGQNMNISGDQLQQVFGSSTISDLASQLGMSEDQAGPAVAGGHQPPYTGRASAGDGNEEIAQGLSMLANSEGLK